MDNTSRVAQWRQKMRDEGKESMTIWLGRDAKLRLEDMASIWRVTPSEMIEQALAQFQPGSPQSLCNITDTSQLHSLMQDTVRAMWPKLKQELVQELRGDVAVTAMNGNVTETLHTQEYAPEAGHDLVTEPMPAPASESDQAPIIDREPLPESPKVSSTTLDKHICDWLREHPEGESVEGLSQGLRIQGSKIRLRVNALIKCQVIKMRGTGRALRYVLASNDNPA